MNPNQDTNAPSGNPRDSRLLAFQQQQGRLHPQTNPNSSMNSPESGRPQTGPSALSRLGAPRTIGSPLDEMPHGLQAAAASDLAPSEAPFGRPPAPAPFGMQNQAMNLGPSPSPQAFNRAHQQTVLQLSHQLQHSSQLQAPSNNNSANTGLPMGGPNVPSETFAAIPPSWPQFPNATNFNAAANAMQQLQSNMMYGSAQTPSMPFQIPKPDTSMHQQSRSVYANADSSVNVRDRQPSFASPHPQHPDSNFPGFSPSQQIDFSMAQLGNGPAVSSQTFGMIPFHYPMYPSFSHPNPSPSGSFRPGSMPMAPNQPTMSWTASIPQNQPPVGNPFFLQGMPQHSLVENDMVQMHHFALPSPNFPSSASFFSGHPAGQFGSQSRDAASAPASSSISPNNLNLLQQQLIMQHQQQQNDAQLAIAKANSNYLSQFASSAANSVTNVPSQPTADLSGPPQVSQADQSQGQMPPSSAPGPVAQQQQYVLPANMHNFGFPPGPYFQSPQSASPTVSDSGSWTGTDASLSSTNPQQSRWPFMMAPTTVGGDPTAPGLSAASSSTSQSATPLSSNRPPTAPAASSSSSSAPKSLNPPSSRTGAKGRGGNKKKGGKKPNKPSSAGAGGGPSQSASSPYTKDHTGRRHRGKNANNFMSPIVCGLIDSVDPTTHEVSSVSQIREYNNFFGKTVRLFSATEDPERRPLYQTVEILQQTRCPNNYLAMYLTRRKRQPNSGIYQASSIVMKKETDKACKVGGYFLTMDACQKFKQYWDRRFVAGPGGQRTAVSNPSNRGSSSQPQTNTRNSVKAEPAAPVRTGSRFSSRLKGMSQSSSSLSAFGDNNVKPEPTATSAWDGANDQEAQEELEEEEQEVPDEGGAADEVDAVEFEAEDLEPEDIEPEDLPSEASEPAFSHSQLNQSQFDVDMEAASDGSSSTDSNHSADQGQGTPSRSNRGPQNAGTPSSQRSSGSSRRDSRRHSHT